MKKLGNFVARGLLAGLLVITPIYLAGLLLLKAAASLSGLVRPIAKLLPAWVPAEHILSVVLVLVICFFIGITVRTPTGRAAWKRLETSVFQKIPGYVLFQSFTARLAGQNQDQVWQPALAEIEEALVPAFIIERLNDGRFTVFVPSAPTPFTGSVYILSPDRVHPLDVPFVRAIQTLSRWGSGAKELVAAMEKEKTSSTGTTAADVRNVNVST
jgi:uncharacterized membrane protein